MCVCVRVKGGEYSEFLICMFVCVTERWVGGPIGLSVCGKETRRWRGRRLKERKGKSESGMEMCAFEGWWVGDSAGASV